MGQLDRDYNPVLFSVTKNRTKYSKYSTQAEKKKTEEKYEKVKKEAVKNLKQEERKSKAKVTRLCEVLSIDPRSTGDPLMDLMSVPDNNAWCRVD